MTALVLFDLDIPTCPVADCDKPTSRRSADGNSYCYAHYMVAWRYGDPNDGRGSRNPDNRCLVCGEPIPQVRGYRGRAITRLFCTHTCANLQQRARLYGTTGAAVLAMYEQQHHQCAICRRELDYLAAMDRDPQQRRRIPRIDHNHSTGQVRGLLCDACNKGIGTLGEDPATLRAAADYLERHSDSIPPTR